MKLKIDIPTRVDNGMRVLSNHLPEDWRDRIDCDKLDVGDVKNCPLGQLFGGYFGGTRALQFDLESEIVCGFEANAASEGTREEMLEEYEALTKEWKRQLVGVS